MTTKSNMYYRRNIDNKRNIDSMTNLEIIIELMNTLNAKLDILHEENLVIMKKLNIKIQ